MARAKPTYFTFNEDEVTLVKFAPGVDKSDDAPGPVGSIKLASRMHANWLAMLDAQLRSALIASDGTAKFPRLRSIRWELEVIGAQVRISWGIVDAIEFDLADISGFVLHPQSDGTVIVEFTVRAAVTEQQAGRLCMLIGQQTEVSIEQRQTELAGV